MTDAELTSKIDALLAQRLEMVDAYLYQKIREYIDLTPLFGSIEARLEDCVQNDTIDFLADRITQRIDTTQTRIDRIEEGLSRSAERGLNHTRFTRWGLVARLTRVERRCRQLEIYNGIDQD